VFVIKTAKPVAILTSSLGRVAHVDPAITDFADFALISPGTLAIKATGEINNHS
jgi:hypothetical protein